MTDSTDVRNPQANRGTVRTVAAWVGAASLIISVVLFVLYLPAVQQQPLFLVLFAVALVTAVAALVLAARSRKVPQQKHAVWALTSAVLGIVVNVALIVVMVVGVLTSRSSAQVELEWESDALVSVSIVDDAGTHVMHGQSDGRKQYATKASSAEVTLTNESDDDSSSMSCRIRWNGEVVSSEESSGEKVTCQYDTAD